MGSTNPAPNGGKQFFGCFPSIFGSKSTIIPFGKRVRAGQYSLVSFFFTVLLLKVPCAQPFVKVIPHVVLSCGADGSIRPRNVGIEIISCKFHMCATCSLTFVCFMLVSWT